MWQGSSVTASGLYSASCRGEDTIFQKQLGHTRELLAKTYLANTDMTAEDIAFLLGYQEIGSFLRAFTIWTGQTASEYRQRND